jgi:hypothetical protein
MGQPDEKQAKALEDAAREAAGRRAEDQGTEGGLTEATHGSGEENPERREGEVPPSD